MLITAINLWLYFTSVAAKAELQPKPQPKPPIREIYSITAPKVLRPFTNYHVSVSIYNTSSATNVVVQLTGGTRVSSELDLRSGETGLITFKIDNWPPGEYQLTVLGRRGLDFRNQTSIRFVPRSFNVFVQTDKSVYRGSQKVQFRAIILDKDLWPRPITTEIFITDAQNNTVKHYPGLNPKLGLVSEELQLPDQPVLGDWTIHVIASGQEYNKTFTVAEFNQPGYYVKVKLSPSFITYDNPEVKVTISADYTYGKPVKGSVTLTVIPKHRTSSLSLRPLDSYQIILPLDKEVTQTVNVRSVLNLITDKLSREIEFMAIVEEEFTGRRFNNSNSIFIYDDPVKLEFIKTSQSFKPGLAYKAFLKVSRQDNTPINVANTALTLKYQYNYKPGSVRSTQYRIPKNGLIELNFYPPLLKDTVTIFVKADFNGKKYDLAYVDKAYSKSDTYMQISLNSPFVKVDQEVEILVNCTSFLPRYVYQVIARGDILRSRSVYPTGGNSHSFKVKLSRNMVPLVRIVVYFISSGGEVVADGLSFDLDDIFENQISITAGPGRVKPGDEVRIGISSTSNAMVGIMGIDRNILLDDPSNDITKQNVIDSMESFDAGKKDSDQQMMSQLRQGRALFYPGSLSASSVFDDAGVVVITNGEVSSFDRRRSQSAPPIDAVSSIQIVRFGSLRPPTNPPKRRTPFIDVDFPPTWLWWNKSISDDSTSFKAAVPNTLTSYIISAFSISPASGLALAPNTAMVTAFERFYVRLEMPYSVILGEIVSIQVVVFNQNDRSTQVRVTMSNPGDFEFVTVEDNPTIRRAKQMEKYIEVPGKQVGATYFMIKPKKFGFVKIKASASSSFASSRIEDNLRVLPTGIPHHFNHPHLIDLRSSSLPVNFDVNLGIPRTVIEGSETIEVTAVADVMGPVINNLGNLLRIPIGCGEQNMVNFVPNIVVMNYLKARNLLSNALYLKAVANVGTGYQRQLTYKHDDGSFSAFGKNDVSGSTWLTSYVIKSFKQAKEYIPDMIDDAVVKKAMQWLSKQLIYNGTFAEPGTILNKDIQGPASQGLALTAYTLIALHMNKEHYDAIDGIKQNVADAQTALERYYFSVQDTYSLSIIAYALQLVGSSRKEEAFQQLAAIAQVEDGKMFWSTNKMTPTNPEEAFHLQHSVNIEMTAYGLMSYVLRGDISTAMKIMKWLVEQMNSIGGFTSSQDTVMAIEALEMLAKSLNIGGRNIKVTYSYDDMPNAKNDSFPIKKSMDINNADVLNQQTALLPRTVRNIRVSADGRGMALVQVSWKYNIEVSAPNPSFELNPLVDKASTKGYLQVSTCIKYISEGESGMTVMEFYAPSGYVIDSTALSSIMQEPAVKRVELHEDNTMVAIYFDKIGKEHVCPTVSSHFVHRVANQQLRPVIVYDYYNRAKIARVFYRPNTTKKSNICDGYECDAKKDKHTGDKDGKKKSGGNYASGWPSVIAVLILIVHIFK